MPKFRSLPPRASVHPNISPKHGRPSETTSSVRSSFLFTPRGLFLLFLLLAGGILHTWHISNMFENDGRFSYLSRLERELKFRTELGFYYSYFKEIIEASSFLQGVKQILMDNISEYPDVINALRRFNLYPEVVTAAAYRVYKQTWDAFGWATMDCFNVNRGNEMPPVESCEGLGEPAYFYVTCVMLVNGLTPMALGLISYWLAGHSLWAVFISQLAFFANHSECTRVQWHPGLRENFAYPFSLVQQAVLVAVVQSRSAYLHTFYEKLKMKGKTAATTKLAPLQLPLVEYTRLTWWEFGVLFTFTLLYLLPWQFAQFPLFLQCVMLFVAGPVLQCFPADLFCDLIVCLWTAVIANVLLQFANPMLLTSFLLAGLSALICIYRILPTCCPGLMCHRLAEYHIRHPVLSSLLQGVVFMSVTLMLKIGLSNMFSSGEEDHVWQILRSKFTSFAAFHTLIYTCSPEFNFYDVNSFGKLSKTLLLPTASLSFFGGVGFTLWYWLSTWFPDTDVRRVDTSKPNDNDDVTVKPRAFTFPLAVKVPPVLVLVLAQTVFFTSMAMLIMRLKLFFTPQLCIQCSMVAHPHLWRVVIRAWNQVRIHRRNGGWLPVVEIIPEDEEMSTEFVRKEERQAVQYYRVVFLVLFCAAMMVQGGMNLQHEVSIGGEFSNFPLENLVYWIRKHTTAPEKARPGHPPAVFTGSMPTMATVRLTTRRYIILHPHYEDASLRDRVFRAYHIFSRRPVEQVWRELRVGLGATHLVFELAWCYSSSRPGCKFPEIYDLHEPEFKERKPLCEMLDMSPDSVKPYFFLVYQNESYKVYRLMEPDSHQ